MLHPRSMTTEISDAVLSYLANAVQDPNSLSWFCSDDNKIDEFLVSTEFEGSGNQRLLKSDGVPDSRLRLQ